MEAPCAAPERYFPNRPNLGTATGTNPLEQLDNSTGGTYASLNIKKLVVSFHESDSAVTDTRHLAPEPYSP